MQTRCPACLTTFRVTPEQLAARNGMVRCGHCRAPFNALQHLVDEVQETPETPAQLADARDAPSFSGNPPASPVPSPHPLTPPATAPAVPTPQPATPPAVSLGELSFWLPDEPVAPAGTDASTSAPPAPDTPPASDVEDTHPVPAEPRSYAAAGEVAADPAQAAPAETPPLATHPAPLPPMVADADIRPHYTRREPTLPDAPPLVFRRRRPEAETGVVGRLEPSDAPVQPADPRREPGRDDATEVPPAPPSIQPLDPLLDPRQGGDDADWNDYTPVGRKHARRRNPLLGFALFLTLLVLAAQLVFLEREPLTRWFPSLRPPLEDLCARFGCSLPLARQIQAITLQASDLHPVPEKSGIYRLEASLRNEAGYPQAYPSLELSLNDTSDRPLLRRVLAPTEWLPAGTRAEQGMPPHGEIALQLYFTVNDVQPVGYRLYTFYP